MSENDKPVPPNDDASNDQANSSTTETAFLPSEELSEVQRQRDEYLDRFQRTLAEFNNYQKRAKRKPTSIDNTPSPRWRRTCSTSWTTVNAARRPRKIRERRASSKVSKWSTGS